LNSLKLKNDKQLKIILASGSPRRKELLKMIEIKDFAVIPDETEEIFALGLTPEQSVCKTALQKAKNVSKLCNPDDLIIAADTEVYLDGQHFGKPTDAQDAEDMLKRLSGRCHTVYTGLAIILGDDIITGAESTAVYFRELSDKEITNYVKTGEPMDKAGAYGVQGMGSVFIERLEGDFFNVMGLPVCRLTIMLRNLGVDI